MIEFLPIIGFVLVAPLLVLINAIVTSPKAYEDKEGFHYGEPKN